jgi:hypothetical protein
MTVRSVLVCIALAPGLAAGQSPSSVNVRDFALRNSRGLPDTRHIAVAAEATVTRPK